VLKRDVKLQLTTVTYYYYYYIRLTAVFFQDNLGKPTPFVRDDLVAVASAEPYTNHLHLAADR